MTEPSWQPWAPPLDPPVSGGLPEDAAEAIADQWWATDPNYALGLMWQSYALMQPPTPVVSAVNTGAQSVTYSPAAPLGPSGGAMQRAEWYLARSEHGCGLVSVPLTAGLPADVIGLGWVVSEP